MADTSIDDADFEPSVGEVVEANRAYAAAYERGLDSPRPVRRLVIVTCMDARIPVFGVFGLHNGDSHIIRNAGGIVTDDVIRSLAISQRFLGTREIIVAHHTRCGMEGFPEADFRRDLAAETGMSPSWAAEGFDDPFADVRQSIERLKASRFLLHTDAISGFVYDVDDGVLHPVDA